MKKILIVSNYSGYYGSEKMLSYINSSLNGKYEVFLCLNAENKFHEEIHERYHCNVSIENFNVISQNNKLISLKSILFWFKTVRRINPDMVIVNISLIPEVLFIAKLLNIPLFVFVRESLIDYRKMFIIYKHFLNFVATKIVCNSNYTLSMFGSNSKISLLPDVVQFTKHKNKLGIKSIPKTTVFTYVGRLSERKGVVDLLRAISILEKDDSIRSNFSINIVGSPKSSDEKYYQSLREIAKGLKAHVNFLGYLDDPSEVVSQSNFSVCPSLLPETFGLTVLESMIQGVPVIARDVGAYSELVQNGKNGFLFNDLDSLVLALRQAILLRDAEYTSMKASSITKSKSYGYESYKSNLLKEVENAIHSNRKSWTRKIL